MSNDIEKLAVFDSRIVQSRAKYAVSKGALSLTNAPFSAISATASQHTYNIYVPSENVFLDRKLLWTSTVFMSMTVTQSSLPTQLDSLVVPGRDMALVMLPLNSLCSTISATINDTTTVINSQDVLYPISRLVDLKKNRLVRTAPTMCDKFANYNDAYGCVGNPLAGYDAMADYDNVPNGANPFLIFTTNTGVPLQQIGTLSPAFVGATYASINGVPVFDNTILGSGLVSVIFFKWTSTEPIVLSPFVFSDEFEWDTGLFGLSNIQLLMNFKSSPDRVIRSTSRAGRTLSNITYNTAVANGAVFQNSKINASFLSPAIEIPLPPKSIVPYMEFPRYISQTSEAIAPGAKLQIESQTITLPSIPDLLIIFARPTAQPGFNDADFFFPLATSIDGTNNPMSFNFDNFSGLLSSFTTEQIFNMSVKNGLNMDYATFIGQGKSAGGSYPAMPNGQAVPASLNYAQRQQGQNIPLVGSVVVLKPSQDITLSSGQAPSLVGNFTLQFNMTIKNTSDVVQGAQLVVITVNSGFFESIRGSSRVIKGVLSEQDIISAPIAPMGVRSELERMVGGFSFSSLGNMLSKARDIYNQTKPIVSAVKGFLPDSGMLGSVRSGLDSVGYGTGAGTGGRKKSLANRLM